jgi:uncharacterized protein
MRLWDVNLWVYAFRADSPMHGKARALLLKALEAREPFLFCPAVASSFLRLVTNPRIFKSPSEDREAWAFLDYLETHPAAVFAPADAMAFGIFKYLCLVSAARGNDVPDAFLAALAIRYDAALVTADSGMRKWPGLKVEENC